MDRDNLVFKAGTMHILGKDLEEKVSLDPKTCRFQAHVDQRSRVTGGTRQSGIADLLNLRRRGRKKSPVACQRFDLPARQ